MQNCAKCAKVIHSKSEKSLRILLFSLKKSAEKVRKLQRQNFATNVRNYVNHLKSLRNATLKKRGQNEARTVFIKTRIMAGCV